MKVCFLITGLGIGGAERHLLKLVPKLRFDKFIISLSVSNEFGKIIEEKGIKVYYLGMNKFNFPLAILKFWKIIRSEKPDLIDTYLIHSNIFGRIFGRLFGVKFIICSIRSDYSYFKKLNFIDKLTKRFVDLYILNSKVLLPYITIKNKVQMEKVKILPNGVDIERIYQLINKNYDIRKELGLRKDIFIVASVSRLFKEKNLTTLIKAIQLVNDSIYLVIVGDGPERKNLINLSKKLNLEHKIFLLGTRKDVYNIMNSIDVFILPSIREGMSNALLEAMALKKLCIVSNIPQNTELIKDGLNGFVYETLNERDLANKIDTIYKTRKFDSLKQEAYNLIKNKHHINRVLENYTNIIESHFRKLKK